jgi:hypothetical protein
MELRIREVDEGGEGPFDKLRDRGSFSTVEQKVQMEELQWGFPIATTLSLNKLISINGKEEEE